MDPSELKKMIDRLNRIEEAKSSWSLLEKKREEIERILEQLKEERHTLLLNREKNLPVPNINEKEEMIAFLKQKKRELDTLLDEMEQEAEEQTHFHLAKIITHILANHPQEREEYLEIDFPLKKALHLEGEAFKMKQMLLNLFVYPDKIIEIRQWVKKRVFLAIFLDPIPME